MKHLKKEKKVNMRVELNPEVKKGRQKQINYKELGKIDCLSIRNLIEPLSRQRDIKTI